MKMERLRRNVLNCNAAERCQIIHLLIYMKALQFIKISIPIFGAKLRTSNSALKT